VLAHYLGVDSLSDDELTKITEMYDKNGLKELNNKLQATLDKELDIDPSQVPDEDFLKAAYAKLNFKIEHVDFEKDNQAGASSTSQESDKVHITIP
jgi:hypothetical protein